MKRDLCQSCQKPLRACICQFFCSIDNQIKVIALQHPSEVNQNKGTLTLLKNSLSNIEVIEGEDFTENKRLNEVINHYKDTVCLLYPSEKSLNIENLSTSEKHKPKVIIVLDGTWKKSYKMYQLSKNLHNLPHIKLPEGCESLYQIRKTKKDNALSTLEATVLSLTLLENNQTKYKKLIENFVKFNQFQLSFRP